MSAGLAASTVTPGSTAPDVSLTVPATALVCANAATGSSIRSAAPNMVRATVRMPLILPKLHNNRMKPAERNRSVAIVQHSYRVRMPILRALPQPCGLTPRLRI